MMADGAARAPPPRPGFGARARARLRNFVGTPGNALITAAVIAAAAAILPRLWGWAVTGATWTGADRKACTGEGACWVFVRARLNELLYGGYPADQAWRVNLCALGLAGLMALSAFPHRFRRAAALLLILVFPVLALVLLRGGAFALEGVETRLWGGLLLNFVLTFIAVVVAVPLGLLLAEGRRSSHPEIAGSSIAFIEFWRAAPIVTILFFGVVILPLLLPPGVEFNKFTCVAVALALFASAYMAEAIRGGLQSVPKGQYEAALSLNLSPWQARALVVWPEALRVSLPAIVNTAIDLFKDTSLVTIVGLFDVLGSLQQALKDPQWLGLAAEGYAAVAAAFYVLCSLLSALSRRLERELAVEGRG